MNHKLLITKQNETDLTIIAAVGGEVIADYDDSVLIQVTGEEAAQILRDSGLEVSALPTSPIRIASTTFEFEDAVLAESAAPTPLDVQRTAYYIVQFVGPIKGEWLQEMTRQGARMHYSLPSFGGLYGMLPSIVPQIMGMSFVEGVTPYRPAMKVSAKLRNDAANQLGQAELESFSAEFVQANTDSQQIEISLFPDANSTDIIDQIRADNGTILSNQPTTIAAITSADTIEALANQQGVVAIMPHTFPQLYNDIARDIINVPPDNVINNSLTLTGAGQIVAVADSGLDTGDPNTVHADFAGRVLDLTSFPIRPEINVFINNPPNTDDGPQDTNSGHGTHVAGSVLGDGTEATSAGSAFVPRGVAPAANLVFQAIEQQANFKSAAQLMAEGRRVPPNWPPNAISLWGLPANLNNLFTPAYMDGARIHTNSWGRPDAGAYTDYSADVDRFMWQNRDMLILFAAGNEGVDIDGDGVIDASSIGAPATAKNCVAVGATENNRPVGSVPAPGLNGDWDNLVDSTGAQIWPALGAAGHVSDDPDGMAAFSSRGPTIDGRIKPDLVAPGTNVLSTRSSRIANPASGDLPVGDALNDFYQWKQGTSMATPLVAGAAALVRQHLIDQRGHIQDGVKPSGALIKAFLINGTQRISGQFGDEIPNTWPNDVAGFGRVDVINSITPEGLGQALFADEPDYAVSTGQMRVFDVAAIDLNMPLRITLTWTDAPAAAGIGGLINTLYLQLVAPDGTVTNGDTSPFPIVTNNVQQIEIAAPIAGLYQLRVRGVSVTQHAPAATIGDAADPHQDFALVVSNGMGLSTQPVSIAQAIDTTGSMRTFGYMEPAKERASQLVNFLRTNDKLSVTEFSTRQGQPDARTPYPLRRLGSFTPDWQQAHQAIAGLRALGRTPIGAGLAEAWNQLRNEPANRPKAIILLSDGFNNEPPDVDDVLDEIPNDVPIFTIALGPASNVATLNNIANSRPGGAYFAVESDEDIHRLHSIYAQIQALAVDGDLIGLNSAEFNGSQSAEMHVDQGTQEASFTLSWSGAQLLKLVAISPSGVEHSANTAATIERQANGLHLLRVAAPEPGTWKLYVDGEKGDEDKPTRYTLAGVVQNRLSLSAHLLKQSPEGFVLRAKLMDGHSPFDDAKLVVHVRLPQRSRAEILDEYGDAIDAINLGDQLLEKNLSASQIRALRLAVFAQKSGDLYKREQLLVEMSPEGNGVWYAELPVWAAGKLDMQIVAEGEREGTYFCRIVTRSVEIAGK